MSLSPCTGNPAQSIFESMLSIFMNNMANSIHWKWMNFIWVGFIEPKTGIETEDKKKGIVHLSYLFIVYFLQLFFPLLFFSL